MAFNNVMPAWLLFEVCASCGRDVMSRDTKPGVDCQECGGTCILVKKKKGEEEE
jgi:DNA-directed RNA polymerase subunit RPC12/RpoP